MNFNAYFKSIFDDLKKKYVLLSIIFQIFKNFIILRFIIFSSKIKNFIIFTLSYFNMIKSALSYFFGFLEIWLKKKRRRAWTLGRLSGAATRGRNSLFLFIFLFLSFFFFFCLFFFFLFFFFLFLFFFFIIM